jgi:uncharacterized repeat protein (TIGR02543 family)
MTLYAKWIPIKYTVTFDSMGGSPIGSITTYFNNRISAPVKPTKTGYTFDGWFKDAECIYEWNFETDVVKDNTTLYAKWVFNRVTAVYLNKTAANLRIGESLKLTATINPLDASNKNVTWTSSNTSVARVDSTGKVTAVGNGTAIIRVSTKDGGYSAVCTVRVNGIATPISISAAPSSYNSIRVSWSGVIGASGYVIYRSTNGIGPYTLIASTSAVSYNNTGLATNRMYYYRVRSYRIVGRTKAYSNFSSILSVKLK